MKSVGHALRMARIVAIKDTLPPPPDESKGFEKGVWKKAMGGMQVSRIAASSAVIISTE